MERNDMSSAKFWDLFFAEIYQPMRPDISHGATKELADLVNPAE